MPPARDWVKFRKIRGIITENILTAPDSARDKSMLNLSKEELGVIVSHF